MKNRSREDVMVMTTPEVRRQLKIIAAMIGSAFVGWFVTALGLVSERSIDFAREGSKTPEKVF